MSAFCKILTEKGFNFVCMPDGTKLPLQIHSLIRQDASGGAEATQRGCATVSVSVFIDKRLIGPMVEFENGVATLLGKPIPGVETARAVLAQARDDNDLLNLVLTCEVVDTIEQPVTLPRSA